MSAGVTIPLGILCGLSGCALPAYLFEYALQRSRMEGVSVLSGVAAIVVSFAFMSLCILVMYVVAQGYVLVFGSSMVGMFLVFWGIEAMRAMRAMR